MPEVVIKIFVYAIPVLFAITVHEVAHGWVASKLGDQTARMMGRLTLNPVKHIDPVGTILVPLVMLLTTPFLFGWAKPVPVNERNLKRPRQDIIWVALAGPGANLLMLILWAILAKVLIETDVDNTAIGVVMMSMSLAGIFINTILMLFNLIPIPPTDGSRVVASLLPPKIGNLYNSIGIFGMVLLVLLMFLYWPDFYRVVSSFNTHVYRFLFL